jgi:hypothetical protein
MFKTEQKVAVCSGKDERPSGFCSKTRKETPVSLKAGVHWIVSSFPSLLSWWLDNNMPSSPEEMDQIFRTLTHSGLEKGLGLKVSWYDELSS